MKNKIVIGFIVFCLTLAVHAFWITFSAARVADNCGVAENASYSFWRTYTGNQEYLTGLSIALSLAFTVWAALSLSENKGRSACAIGGGVSLTGILMTGGCFLGGCCGSPMLLVYFSFLGVSLLGVAKLLAFIITLVSVAAGIWWIEIKNQKNVLS